MWKRNANFFSKPRGKMYICGMENRMIVNPGFLAPISTYLPIKSWSEEDRPREKLIRKGAHTLSHTELLAILINCGTEKHSAVSLAREVLNSCGNNLAELGRLEVSELRRFHGIGLKKAVTILAALELSKRKLSGKPIRKTIISTAREASDWLRPLLADQPCECFYTLFLNQANRLLHHECISKGGITSTTVDPRVVFRFALHYQSTRLILAHNHPSGNLRPSRADISLTRKMKNAGKMLDIQIADHIIVAEDGYFSMEEDGLMGED